MKKKILLALLLAVLAAEVVFAFSRFTFVNGRLISNNSDLLDLRGIPMDLADYEKLSEKLPEADIQFEISFQGRILDSNIAEVTVTTLTEEDIRILAALPRLRTVRAENCQDFEALASLKQLRPDLQVKYHVPLGGKRFASDAVQLNLTDIREEEIPLLQYLPYVKTVTVSGGEPEALVALKEVCTQRGIAFRVQLEGQILSGDVETLTLTGAGTDTVNLLHLFSGLKEVHFIEPTAEGAALIALAEALPETQVTWEKTVFGLTFSQDAKEVDLTPVMALGANQKLGDRTVYQRGLDYPVMHTDEEVRSAVKIFKGQPLPDKARETASLIEEVKAAMAYFPEVETLVMCGCLLDNEAMAAFREEQRENYKVVWSVECGEIAFRTDTTFIMPVKYRVYYLNTKQTYNLRYCEEVTAVDIGHMSVNDISFVEFMPDLEYLILAHTNVQNIDPLAKCQKLKFLEVDHTAVQDLTPLQSCTALEDLNIGNTWCPVDPLKEMTWLKNLWMIFRGKRVPELAEVLTDTNIVYQGTATVDSGWRDLPNYFDMRDALKMHYMSW